MLKVLPKYLFVAFIFCAMLTQAQAKKTSVSKDTLLVGVVGSEPFVFKENNKGIAIEIWRKIAVEKSWNFKYAPFEKVDDALSQLNSGGLDIVVGPISITSKRLKKVSFSQPFYNSSISIISRIDNQSLWQSFLPFFSLKLLLGLLVFLIVLGIIGTLLWLAERKQSPKQFPKSPLKGIGNGMWLAIVTMTTTGYGDKAPVTLLGRLITGAWMLISIIFATSIIAGVVSTLTISSLDSKTISSIEQLYGRKAATIANSPSETFLNKFNIKVTGENNLNEAIKKLKSKSVDAVVYDNPQLLYFLKNNDNEDLYISKAEYYKQGYGFAFPLNSKLLLDVNRILLELSENQETERIIHYYIQKEE